VTDNEVLGSWKEIADYLGKEIRTCWRWEKELGLPVHRIDSHSSRSRVFAYKSEIDNWLRRKASGSDHGPRRRWWRRKGLAAGLGLFLAALVPLALWLNARRASSRSPETRLTSIAVLPLADAEAPKQEAYYAEGITQEIIKSLRNYDRIAVIPVPAALGSPALSEEPGLFGGDLGLDYVLKGYLSRQGDSVYLVIDFVTAKDEKLVWTSKYREPLRNLVRVNDDIQSRICGTLDLRKPRLTSVLARNLGGGNPATLEDYIKGTFVLSRLEAETNDPWLLYHQGKFYGGQNTAADNELAISLFREALTHDPAYAQAYIGLANCYLNYVAFNWDYRVQWLVKAEELLNKAQAIEPNLPDYYGTLLVVFLQKQFAFDEDHDREILELAAEGLRRYPNDQQLNSIMAVYYYRKHGRDGQLQDLARAKDCKRRAFWLNPYAFNNIIYAEMLLLDREFEKAVEVCRLAEKLDGSLMARALLGEVYYFQGDLDRSRSVFLSFDSMPRMRLMSLYYLAMIYARRGDSREARSVLNEIKLLSPGDFVFFPDKLNLASAYLGLGERETGLKYLADYMASQRTAGDRFINCRYIDLDPNFDRYRNDPKFVEIMKMKESSPWLRAEKSN
jgi:TolB-like protein/TPR repeat protein